VVGLQTAHEAIRALRFGEREHFGIGLVPGIGQGLVARTLQRIRADHPELSIELQVDLTVPLLDALHAGLIDIALVHLAPGLDLGRFSLVPAGNEPLYAMVHPILAVEPRSRTDDTAAWALPPRDEPVRQLVEAAMLQGGFPTPQDVIELPLHAGAAELAQQLDVIVVLPESLALPYVQCGALQRLDLPFALPLLTLGLLRARHADYSAGAALILREVQGVIADLGPEHAIERQALDQRRPANVMP
jgi:DNA-binding transcriptional LysR family regulator